MNHKIFRPGLFFLAAVLFFSAGPLLAQKVPAAYDWVNDYAGVITPDFKEKINGIIKATEESTSTEIAVVTINSIAPYSEVDYARKLFDTWKPGKKGKDNGVLILVAIQERRWRIETGYGVEGILPDGLCGQIGRDYMVPYFKAGNYSLGLLNGVTEIARILGGGAPSQPINPKSDFFTENLGTILFFCFFIFLFWQHLGRFLPPPNERNLFDSRSHGGSWYSEGSGGGGFSGGGFGGFGGGGGGGGGAGGGF